uniref:Uncharacterized protein n=1 Tax=Rousettus aegyptiacus TaxID=9407 RepID=A0A7J8F0X2_ROUAE|nr:hypothetical protein HJG63_012378 [Rousettus aegyptiacus]
MRLGFPSGFHPVLSISFQQLARVTWTPGGNLTTCLSSSAGIPWLVQAPLVCAVCHISLFLRRLLLHVGFSHWLGDLRVSTAFLASLGSGNIRVPGASMVQQPAGTVARSPAGVAGVKGAAAQPREVIHGPGPGLFSVQAQWHGGLRTFPHPTRVFQRG